MKKIILAATFLLALAFPVNSFAQTNSYATIVNPVRGSDFWDHSNPKPVTVVEGQLEVLRQQNTKGTFLLRYDVFKDTEVVEKLKNSTDEKGIFLEVTPTLTTDANIRYHESSSWHSAASVLITGYSVDDRKKLIDKSFEEFKTIFGNYPKSVGAWWIDANSISYMQEKYDVTGIMIVADQYSTDGYQIWGQYWGTPYMPAKNNALFPAQKVENKIPVVITQWAVRDPVNGYGTGVEESTFSVQPNDYIDFHDLDINYFASLVDIYTGEKNCSSNPICQITIGLENTYSWEKYKDEYQRQVKVLADRQKNGQLSIATMEQFSNLYLNRYPELSPEQFYIASDPLGSSKVAAWYMNTFYRAGWISNNEGSVIRDLRQYVEGQDEICLIKICDQVNFATFATRVLDEVTYGQRRVVDEGRVTNIKTSNTPNKNTISYLSAASSQTVIEFLPRDIAINGKVSSIDGLILETINQPQAEKQSFFNNQISLVSSIATQIFRFLIFWIFIVIAVLIPGEVVIKKQLSHLTKSSLLFLSTVTGLVELTIITFVSGLIFGNYILVPFWAVLNIGLYIYLKLYRSYPKSKHNWQHFFLEGLLLLGALFITIPTFRSGLEYGYGIGFWGPNGHDGVWHLALVNQLMSAIPPQNPILSGLTLRNYHYFYDLLTASISTWTMIPSVDLVFRFLPFLFALLLGLGTLSLLAILGKKGFVTYAIGLYFIYTAGSFGWIVELIKNRGWNGESAFWANQSISFNLNPPFIISLLILVAIVELLIIFNQTAADSKKKLLLIPLILLSGTLLGFKVYAAILIGLTLSMLFVIKLFKRDFSLLPIIFGVVIVTILVMLPNYPSLAAIFQTGSGVFIFSPFWFIQSMIDSPDRLGIYRLSLTRINGYETGNILKIIYAEGLGLILFLVGNLGMRVFGLLAFLKLSSWKNFNYLIIFILIFFSTIIPILFIQSGTPWNTIQFFYYSLFFTSILSAIVIAKLRQKLQKRIFAIILVLILIITPINCLAVAQGYLYAKPHTFISKEETEALDFLKNQNGKVVLTYPYDKNLKKSLEDPLPLLAYESSAYVSALSKKVSFEEDELQQEILDLSDSPEFKKRIALEKLFFAGMDMTRAKQFLNENKIDFIYLPKIYRISLEEQALGLTKIFENEFVFIYKVNR